ncbi:MAG: hypothetical protein KF850_11565 [Labilithrix sp.]|nr:hypothetical protein [Labilithrix sp.]
MRRAIAGTLAAAAMLGACAVGPKPELEPRYVAVHNAFAAMGLAQVGPIHRASLAEGQDVRFPLELPAECAMVVALGAGGVRDLEVTLLDADGKPVARDSTVDAQASVRACPERAGRFTLHVRMARGAGDLVAASWTGVPAAGAAATAVGPPVGASAAETGSCEAPIALTAGRRAGNTRQGESSHAGGCGNSESKEIVYRLDLPRRQRVTIDVDPTFDSVLYIRKDDCADKDAEVACNDDVSTGSKRNTSSRGSRIDTVLEPATYWVFVDGYDKEAGSFRMNVAVADVPSLEEACKNASPFTGRATATLTSAFDHSHGSCDLGLGPDAIHRLDVSQRARVRVLVRSDEFSPVVHVRGGCTDERSELGCTDSGAKADEAAFVSVLDPGTYAVFADAAEKNARGRYALEADMTVEGGSGVRGDACGDALPIVPNDKPIDGDTFDAKDDVSGRCTARGAPDVLYRFEVTRRSRVTARFTAEEGAHAFVLARSCTDRATELACGTTLDEVLPPGVYSLAVDGTTEGPFGRYTFDLRAKDLTLQEAACRVPAPLALGQTVTGTTAGAGDRFTASCAGREELQASGDRVYKLTIASRTRVELALSTPNHDGALALRTTCLDPPRMVTTRGIEVACNNDAPDNRHSKIVTTLDAGTYFVVVDGHQGKHEGPFTLSARVVK